MKRAAVLASVALIAAVVVLLIANGRDVARSERSVTDLRADAARREAHATEPGDASDAAVRGRVVTAGTGEPVPGARVVVDGTHVRVTDERGEFEIPPAEAPLVDLRITSGTHGSWWTSRPRGPEPIVLELEPGLSVAGRVVSGDGDPVPGCYVLVQDEREERETWTDEDGRFRTGGHVAGPVRIRCEWGEPASATAGDTDVRVTVGGPYLLLSVRDPSGEPVRGARLTHWMAFLSAPSSGDGWRDAYLMEFDPAEPVELVVGKEGYLPARFSWRAPSAAAGVSREVVTLRPRPPNSLSIVVRRADGVEARTAHVRLFDSSGLELLAENVALDEGRGRVPRLPAGRHLLRVFADQDVALDLDQAVTIRPGDDNEARFDLPPGAVVQVHWNRYALRYRLELREERARSGDEPRRFAFRAYPQRDWWGLTTRVPFGQYRLHELRERDSIREERVEVIGTDPMLVDWREEAE